MKSGAKETPGSPLPIGLHEVHLARVRVYVLERGYASGLRERERERERVANYLELPNYSTKNLQEKLSFPVLRTSLCSRCGNAADADVSL